MPDQLSGALGDVHRCGEEEHGLAGEGLWLYGRRGYGPRIRSGLFSLGSVCQCGSRQYLRLGNAGSCSCCTDRVLFGFRKF